MVKSMKRLLMYRTYNLITSMGAANKFDAHTPTFVAKTHRLEDTLYCLQIFTDQVKYPPDDMYMGITGPGLGSSWFVTILPNSCDRTFIVSISLRA